jgi:hypothetical protein
VQPWLIEEVTKKQKDNRDRLYLPLEVWEDVLDQEEDKSSDRGVCIIREPEDEKKED